MEENTNPQNSQETQTVEQPIQEEPVQEEKKVLMPGQEHEDELDYMGGALFGLIKNGFTWLKHLFIK